MNCRRQHARRRPRSWIPAGALACLAVIAATAATGASAHAADSAVKSTGTVVVLKDHSASVVRTVGTSTVTVQAGAEAADVLAHLTASDHSQQTRKIVDASGRVVHSGAVKAGDRLVVTAADGLSTYSYRFAVYDPAAPKRDGVYWDQPLYDSTDSSVNAHTPVFPDRRCDVTAPVYAPLVRQATETYAVGNEAGDPAATSSPLVFRSRQVWFYGAAINAAIKDCHKAGGGIVVVPAGLSRNDDGAYYSGAINLLSGVNLHIDSGAVVKFMRNKSNEYYPVVRTSYEGTDMYNFSPLIYALHQHDIAVTGGGMLDGQEDMWNWRPWKKGYWGEPSVENKDPDADYGENGVLNEMNFEDTPVEQRIFTDDGHLPATIPMVKGGKVEQVAPPAGAKAMKSTFRPQFIETNDSSDVLLEGVKIRNTPFWIVHPLNSTNVLIRGLDIYSDKTKDFEVKGWNNDDGVDPESSRNVVMEDNYVTVSDDGAAIKSGRNVNGREHRAPSQDVIIRNSVYNNDGGNSAAISMGSEMSGGIRDVFIEDNVFTGPGLAMALKIKTNSTRGGVVERIYLRNCTLQQATSGLVQLDGNYPETVPFPNADAFDPTIRDIYIDHVNTVPTMTPGKTTFALSSAASRSPVENVYYRNSIFHTSSTLQSGFDKNKNIKNFVVQNVTYLDPATGATTTYNTTPLNLLDQTTAVTETGERVPLKAVSIDHPDVITPAPTRTFTVAGKFDIARHPSFPLDGTARLFLDRSSTPVAVHVQPGGSFVSDPITLDDNQSWYRDRHYVAVNFSEGIDMNTEVYQVAAAASAQ